MKTSITQKMKYKQSVIKFFRNMGVNWFTFHIGSLESGVYLPTHKHLTSYQVTEVHEQIEEAINIYQDVKVRCPIIYKQCGENDPNKWYCMHPERIKELLVIFTENGIKATHTPMASCFKDDLKFDLKEISQKDILSLPQKDYCPFSYELSGISGTYCRYISKFWNY